MKLRDYNIQFNDNEIIFEKNNKKIISFNNNFRNYKEIINDKLNYEVSYLNGKLHNLKTYALFVDNEKYYFVNGVNYSEKEFKILKFKNNIKKLRK